MGNNYIQNIKEMSDSTEVMYEYPKKATQYFSYIILAILLLVVLWAFFCEKDTYIQANGIVTPSEAVVRITTTNTGTLKAINYTEGKIVQKGEILFSYDDENLKKNKEFLTKDIQNVKDELQNLFNLQQSIITGENLTGSTSLDNKYYSNYSKYLSDIKYASEQYANNTLDLEVARLNLASSVNTMSENVRAYSEKDQQITLLIDNVNNNTLDLLTSTNISAFYTEFVKYKTDIETLKKSITDPSVLDEKLLELKNTFSAQLNNTRTNLRSQLDVSKSNYDLAISSQNAASSKGINLDTIKEQTKLSYLMEANSAITNKETELRNLELEKANIEEGLKKSVVMSPIDGTVTVYEQLVEGQNTPAGRDVLSVLPINSQSNLHFNAYLKSTDIDEIVVGQSVNLRLDALPYSNHHEIEAEVVSVSKDARSDSEGNYFYEVKCALEDNTVLSNSKENKAILVGMTGQMHVITDREKMITWMLRKLDLWV